jgi:hypothetical protein
MVAPSRNAGFQPAPGQSRQEAELQLKRVGRIAPIQATGLLRVTTPGAIAPTLLNQEGSFGGSPPQMRRGGALSDGVVLNRGTADQHSTCTLFLNL